MTYNEMYQMLQQYDIDPTKAYIAGQLYYLYLSYKETYDKDGRWEELCDKIYSMVTYYDYNMEQAISNLIDWETMYQRGAIGDPLEASDYDIIEGVEEE